MVVNDYKLRIATKGQATFYKPYEYDKRYNQVLVIVFKDSGRKSYASVELAISDLFITQDKLNDMQIALNRARKDLIEYKDNILKELEKIL